MKFGRAGKTLVAGAAVYYAMAACEAATDRDMGSSQDGGAPNATAEAGKPVVNNAMADEWYMSGSRLRVRYLIGADGSRQFLGFVDLQRTEACVFTQALGDYRCVPEFAVFTESYWAKSDCTGEPLYYQIKGIAAPKYVLDGKTLHEVGPRFDNGIYAGRPNGCNAITANVRGAFEFMRIGAILPADSFVSASPANE
jgi:hypothetical protein